MSIKASITAPKKSQGASKKNKKSWRKNTSIEDIEEFLDDQRLEERLGGSFDQRKDEELFVVDAKRDVEEEKVTPKRRRARAEKPLKCFQHLEITSGVADPVKNRNRLRTAAERKNPLVIKKENEIKSKGIVKAKERLAQKHREAEKLKKAATLLERTTRRRTEFDFDLWSSPADAIVKKVATDDWLDAETKRHTLKNTRKLQRKLPEDHHGITSALPAVEVPHGGASYNPSLKDHQDLLWRAAVVELKKEKEQHRIDFHTTRMFPEKKDAPDHKTWLAEMSEGVEVLAKKGTAVDVEDVDKRAEDDVGAVETSDEEATDEVKPKTRKQRRKEKLRKAEERKRLAEKNDKLKHSEVFRLKSIRREIDEEEKTTELRKVKKAKAKQAKLLQPATLSGYKFEEKDLDIKLSNELTGNLRSIKPEGNLLEDRYKSLQKRNIIETRVKQKIVKNNKKRKRVEKRSYKMGFSWEK